MGEKKSLSRVKTMDSNFIEAQNKVADVNDDVIKSLFRFDKYISMVTNPIIIDYLRHRFDDSASMVETVHRIKKGVYIKPKCPVCGSPVTWIGKPNRLYTTYCSNPSCYNGSSITKQKKRETLKLHENVNKEKMLREFGVEYNSQRMEHIEHRKETLLKKYGTTKLYTIPEIAKKIKDTVIAKTGYDSYFKVPEVREKAYASIIKNGNTGTSSMEDRVFEYLLELGYEDTIRHYSSEEYPYPCDFYLPSKSMYIEFHGSQFHHGRAFLNTKEDKEELKLLKKRNEERCKETGDNISQYGAMINTWANYDTKKRSIALNNKIKYLEVYSCPNKENLEFQIDMLEMAWNLCAYNENKMPDNIKKEYEEYAIPKYRLKTSVGNKHNTIKYFQFFEFYKQELNIYAHNPIIRRKLIQNRVKYLNKKEEKLTVQELMGGFKKSGIHYGYSHFNPDWVNWFCTTNNIKTIYDPCGGWGHHILGMQNCEKIYYNDINTQILNGVKNMCNTIPSLKTKVVFSNNDARINTPGDVDGFFMCPPYYNLEDYGNSPFANIEEYKSFLNDMFSKWKNNAANVFGIIIPENYVELIEAVPCEKYLINSAASHLTGKKKNNEYFYIFRK